MLSRAWIYVAYMVFFVGVIYFVEWWLGQLYARYVLAYTGIVFMAGMLLGQRSERAWEMREDGPGDGFSGMRENMDRRSMG